MGREELEAQEQRNIAGILTNIRGSSDALRQIQKLAEAKDFDAVKTQLRGGSFSESILRFRVTLILKLLREQESTMEDDTAYRAADREDVRLGQELSLMNKEIDKATLDFSRGAISLAINEAERAGKDPEDSKFNVVASLNAVAKAIDRFAAAAETARDK